jgi:uncharacterized protein
VNAKLRLATVATVAAVLIAAGYVVTQLPSLGAGGLLHPGRQRTPKQPPDSCTEASFAGAGVTLRGWRCLTKDNHRGTLVYLHGIADSRGSAAGVVRRFVSRGFDVIAYDSRAHGESDGEACTYGYYEKDDLRRVLDTIAPGPVVLIGTSLGAAVALQAAAEDSRIAAVVAAEVFSDLESVVRDRAPFIFTDAMIRKALALAEIEARFNVAAVSPVRAASRITVPVLVIHGAADVDTPPEHSQRVYDALAGPRRLIMVADANHNRSLTSAVWQHVDQWIDAAVPRRPGR